MGAASTTDLVLSAASDFSFGALTVLSYVVAIMVSLFVFNWGWGVLRRFMADESFSVGGYFLRKVPYAGYHRFRSKRWNMEHMPD